MDRGACLTAPGSREPSPDGLGPTGFDPSRGYEVVAEMLEYFDGYQLATWAPLASIIIRERRAGLEAAALIAEKWRDENKAGAAKARKSPSEAVASFADQLDGAAIECNAIAHEIRKLGESV